MSKKTRIAIAGLGNLGWNLAFRLFERGYNVRQVIAEKNQRRLKFAKRIEAELIEDPSELKPRIELLFVCVPDDKIQSFVKTVPNEELPIVHCSGSTPLLEDIPNPTGVFYPFQTFTKFFSVDWHGVPIFIESGDEALRSQLRRLGEDLSRNVNEVSFEQRRAIHIAGVFGANFTNHLLYLTKTILDKEKVPFEVMKPLMEETLRKAFDHGPAGAQTGPARRNDMKVVKKHLVLLKDNPELMKFYQLFTESIMKEYKK